MSSDSSFSRPHSRHWLLSFGFKDLFKVILYLISNKRQVSLIVSWDLFCWCFIHKPEVGYVSFPLVPLSFVIMNRRKNENSAQRMTFPWLTFIELTYCSSCNPMKKLVKPSQGGKQNKYGSDTAIETKIPLWQCRASNLIQQCDLLNFDFIKKRFHLKWRGILEKGWINFLNEKCQHYSGSLRITLKAKSLPCCYKTLLRGKIE